MPQEIIIIGAGGLGREVAAMLSQSFSEKYTLKGFVDDAKTPYENINGIYILGGLDWLMQQSGLAVVLAIASPAVKQQLLDKLSQKDFTYPNLIHPSVQLHSPHFIHMGQGNIIAAGNILTVNINLGSFNLINLSCTIGHDVNIANYCSIMPGVNISGGAQIQDAVYLGTGAKLIKATTVHTGATVGAGAVVHTDIPAGEVWTGVPAQAISNPS